MVISTVHYYHFEDGTLFFDWTFLLILLQRFYSDSESLNPINGFVLSYLKIKKSFVFEVSTIVSMADKALWLLLSSLIWSTCIYLLASDAEVTEAFVHVNAGLWVLKLTQTSPTNCELRAVIRFLNEKTCNWSKLFSLLVKTMLEERMSWKTTKNL